MRRSLVLLLPGLLGAADGVGVTVSRQDPALTARIVEAWPLEGVRAGSGLVWAGKRLLVVQDDADAVALVDPATRALEHRPLEGAGEFRAKALKSDWEVGFTLPDGAIVLLGSGSTPARRRIARLDVETLTTRMEDAGPLYDAVAAALAATPNLEGAARQGDVVRLLHRGAGRDPNAIVDVPLAAFEGAPAACGPARRHDLGRIGPVPLTFTDAVSHGGSRLLYLAVAEDTPDAVADGPVVGAAVGVLDAEGGRWAPLLEADRRPSVRKIEGVALDPDGRTAWLVTDPDDPARPAELLRVVLEGTW